eukprot:CAMPEP_0174945938 /NCGR_PEP_ID=MMETSP1355-20121228/82841_1 /TAXON_ID=464990 /ORGANISM="Hemiselmis tepida, Strain CCMP443" /LENGTH=100 /DNA_ID=CAMNT_0016193339 /DNA_START=83 /DNA_END=382 /DNA_ORIENTATION=+
MTPSNASLPVSCDPPSGLGAAGAAGWDAAAGALSIPVGAAGTTAGTVYSCAFTLLRPAEAQDPPALFVNVTGGAGAGDAPVQAAAIEDERPLGLFVTCPA